MCHIWHNGIYDDIKKCKCVSYILMSCNYYTSYTILFIQISNLYKLLALSVDFPSPWEDKNKEVWKWRLISDSTLYNNPLWAILCLTIIIKDLFLN